jgi:hypothetical protein
VHDSRHGETRLECGGLPLLGARPLAGALWPEAGASSDPYTHLVALNRAGGSAACCAKSLRLFGKNTHGVRSLLSTKAQPLCSARTKFRWGSLRKGAALPHGKRRSRSSRPRYWPPTWTVAATDAFRGNKRAAHYQDACKVQGKPPHSKGLLPCRESRTSETLMSPCPQKQAWRTQWVVPPTARYSRVIFGWHAVECCLLSPAITRAGTLPYFNFQILRFEVGVEWPQAPAPPMQAS